MKRDLFFPGLAALLLLALGLMLPGLGTGIWDPWEMDRAHLARQMVGRTKLLVVEQGGGLGDALRRSAGERFFVDNAAEGRPATRPPGQPEGAQAVPVAGGQTLKKAARVLTEGSFHGLLVHESALGDAAAAAAFLDEVSASHPGVAAALVASSRDACDRLVTELEEAMVTATAALLTGGYGLLEPGLDRDALAARWGGTYPFQLHVPCLALDEAEDPAALVGWMDGIQWSRVLARAALAPQEKGGKAPGTGNFGVPPLDHWLTALSYRALGFSETSSRLPGVLLGLLTMAILGLGLRRLAGPRVALLSVAVLLTVPMFLGQSKNMAGEISYTCFLSGGVLAFALMIREGLRAGWLLGFVAAATLLFLSKGLFGLGVLWLVAGSYVLVLGDRRPAALVPWAVLTAGLGVLAALVLVPSEWTFFSHFRFMNHPVNGGPNAYSSWFDFFLRQVGFGAFPWTILLPFAVGALAARLQDDDAAGEERRLAGLLFLWFTVPFVIHAAGMTDFRHLVFPAIPALGAAVALFWLREGEARERPLANGLVAVGVAGVAAVVLQALLKSREPAVNWLTVDPMLSARTAQGAEDASLLGPEARVILALLVLLTFLHHARLSAAVQGVLGVFRRRAPFRIAAWLLGVAFVLKTLGVLADRFGGPTPQKAAGLVDPRILDLPRHLLLHRVDHLLLAGLLGILGLAAFLGGTATGRRVAAVASRVLALPGLRRITAGHRIPPAGGHSGPSPVLLLPGLGLLAWGLLNLVVTFPALPELPAGSLFQGPFPVAAMALAAGLTAAALVWRRRLPAGAAFQAAAAGAALVLLTFAGRLQAATDGSHWDAPLLLALGTAGWAAALVPWLCRSPGLLHGVAAGLGLWLALSVTTPLLQGWNVLEAVVYPEADPPLRRYLFAGSRTTLLLYAAAIGLAANRVAGWLWDRVAAPRGPAGLRWLRPVAWIEAVERPAVHRIAALALAGIFAGVFALGILPGFSREVSQKHILDTYLAAEGRGSIGDNLFKFSPENGGGDDRNFYTAPLPALGSQNDLLDVLTLGVDRAFKVRRSSSHPGPETLMVRAWSEAND
ncbi:MAG: glycosyltransferase family 39 protein, partial [Deltaproteobacteria bacterium]|nr:glycosyltransferase family 39 protein [Deltaproteobacteria bacterium]